MIAVALMSWLPERKPTCQQVREFVEAQGGEANAERVAKEHGAPRWLINWAKRCIKR